MIRKNQKLAIITTWYPPVNGLFVQEQAKALSLYYDVRVFVAYPSIFPKKISNFENGVNVHRYYFPYLPKRASWSVKYWITAFAKKILQDLEEIDIIHAHNYLGGIIAEEVARVLKQPYFVTLHATNLIHRNHSKVIIPFIEKSLRNAKKVICVGQRLEKSVVHDYSLSNTIVIGNLIDISRFDIRKTDNIPFRFIMIAYFTERKGVRHVIDAFSELKHKNIELALVGDADKSQKKYLQLNKDERIFQYGKTPIEDIPIHLSNAHCLISFSEIETFGITVIEAMASGLPVLYCPSGGPEYIVPDWAGIQVERTVNALKKGMESMIEAHHTYDASALRRYVEENYDAKIIVRKFMDIYESDD